MAHGPGTAVFVILVLLATVLFVVCSANYPYKEIYTTHYVDHFNYKNRATFQARYLISGSFVVKSHAHCAQAVGVLCTMAA